MKVLFIAKNIPRPSTKTNKIIYVLAENLSEFCSISFLRPRERIPFWLMYSKKFGDLFGLKGWTYNQFQITTYPYIQLPINKAKYWLMASLSNVGKSFIANDKFDLIHAHYLFPDGYIAYKIFKKYNIPYLITFRSQDKQYLELISTNNPDYRKAIKIIKNAKTVITPNLAYKEFLDKIFDIDCRIIPHGIDKTVFNKQGEKKQPKVILITIIAEAIARKNIDWVIKAFKEYSGRKEIRLHVVGDGPELKNLRQLAGDDKRISFFGRVSHQEVITQLSQSDIFALPSFNETFGLVYLEAAATQNALIGLKHEGVWGVFEEEKEMLFCENLDEFREQLHLLIDNKNIRESMQQDAFAKAKTMSWDSVTKRYKNIYLEL